MREGLFVSPVRVNEIVEDGRNYFATVVRCVTTPPAVSSVTK